MWQRYLWRATFIFRTYQTIKLKLENSIKLIFSPIITFSIVFAFYFRKKLQKKEQILNEDIFRGDFFTLGVILLEVCLLESCSDCYDYLTYLV